MLSGILWLLQAGLCPSWYINNGEKKSKTGGSQFQSLGQLTQGHTVGLKIATSLEAGLWDSPSLLGFRAQVPTQAWISRLLFWALQCEPRCPSWFTWALSVTLAGLFLQCKVSWVIFLDLVLVLSISSKYCYHISGEIYQSYRTGFWTLCFYVKIIMTVLMFPFLNTTIMAPLGSSAILWLFYYYLSTLRQCPSCGPRTPLC